MTLDDIDPKNHGETVIYLRHIAAETAKVARAVDDLGKLMATRAEVESVRRELRGELENVRRDMQAWREEMAQKSPGSWLDRMATMVIKVLTALSLVVAFFGGVAIVVQHFKDQPHTLPAK